jgi:hypothetical protein
MLDAIKSRLRQLLMLTPLGDVYESRMARRQKSIDEALIAAWRTDGCHVPPPATVKRQTVATYGAAFHLRTLIETGTYMGGTMHELRDDFKQLYSIELSPILTARARRRFSKLPHIHILQGDSGEVLPTLMSGITEPCLFWLDGHYSAGWVSARADIETPIIQELNTIFDHPVKDHVILIDDARLFDGTHDYPTLEQMRQFFADRRPQYHFSVVNDIIRSHPVANVDDPFRPPT